MAVIKFDEMQLQFNLPGLDDVAEDAQERNISPEQARLISESARLALEGRMGEGQVQDQPLPTWFEDYKRLIDQGWPWRVATYIAWASAPKTGRWPQTLTELATWLGLAGPRVIYTWRRKFPTIDTTVAMMQAAPLWEHRKDFFAALADVASRPDYKSFNHLRLALMMTKDFTPKLDLGNPGSADDLGELSDAELDLLMGEVARRKSKPDAGGEA